MTASSCPSWKTSGSPRKEGGKGTEIVTLPAGQNLSEMEDVDYFRRKLYRSLNLPPSRIDPGDGFQLGRASEISRDELRFIKFIHRLQNQFNNLFDQVLERQLRLKAILTEKEWESIKDNVRYVWQQDSYFEELKGQEIWTSRLNLLTQMDPYIDRFFSEKWIQREILKFTDDQAAQIKDDFTSNGTPGLPTPDGMGQDEDGENPFGEDDNAGLPFDDEADDILSQTADKPEDETLTKDETEGKPKPAAPAFGKKKPAFGQKSNDSKPKKE
jgi:hypothetical protein